ncbi:MAG: SDR family oxidoreductase [Pseudonocardiaceae bacterium]
MLPQDDLPPSRANHASLKIAPPRVAAYDTLLNDRPTWAINVRASLLLVRAFADQYRPHPAGGRIVLFTTGQHHGPLPAEIPYAATKGALHQITATLADALAERDITVNCVNPGPTNTGWATPEQDAFVARHMPRGRWNTPAEAADVVALLLSPEAATITGQVLDAEAGFRRFTP